MSTKSLTYSAGVSAALLLLHACASTSSAPGVKANTPADAQTPIVATAAAALPSSLHWYLTAAEKRVLYAQIFRVAGDRVLERAQTLKPGTWAVIADADETLLDNGEYQWFLARSGQKYREETWQAWVREQRAVALPGSREFIARIAAAGGAVVVVTNRAEPICDATRENFRKIGMAVAAVLCAPLEANTGRILSDKNPRFAAVSTGSTAAGLPPFEVVAYVGDNIKDFPNRTQQAAEPLAEFGVSLFMLPNPMYGSWESNPWP